MKYAVKRQELRISSIDIEVQQNDILEKCSKAWSSALFPNM